MTTLDDNNGTHSVAEQESVPLHRPDADGRWLRPSKTYPAEPRWGFVDGIQIGLHPLRGPRGLLRVYAPYLDHPRDRLVNFIAVEPIATGTSSRGLSELESSELDSVSGKRFWSADCPTDVEPRQGDEPARGIVETTDGVERLTVFVLSEPFENGAAVYIRVSFRADRPHEVGLTAYRQPGSSPLDYCVLTATMGNFSRLRNLHLADRVVMPQELWPDFSGLHFTEHGRFGLHDMTRNEAGDALVSATPNESEPHRATYAAGTAEHWKYLGSRPLQTWRVHDPDEKLEVLVNGRSAYWASSSPIPGGTTYENFELVEPFKEGREFFFSVDVLD